MPAPYQEPIPKKHHAKSGLVSDDIAFDLTGTQAQYIEITLEPSEYILGDGAAMLFKESSIRMETISGKKSLTQRNDSFLDGVVAEGRPLIKSEHFYTTLFSNKGTNAAKIALAAPAQSTIIPLKLDDYGNQILFQENALLSVGRGISLVSYAQHNILTHLYGKNGFNLLKAEGDGWIFITPNGTLIEHRLEAGQELHIDPTILCAMSPSIQYDIVSAGTIKSTHYKGEGTYLLKAKGPGRLWLQSHAFIKTQKITDDKTPQSQNSYMPQESLEPSQSLGDIFK